MPKTAELVAAELRRKIVRGERTLASERETLVLLGSIESAVILSLVSTELTTRSYAGAVRIRPSARGVRPRR